MLEPPFLELQYYLRPDSVNAAFELLTLGVNAHPTRKRVTVPQAIGLIERIEEVEAIGNVVVLRSEGELFCGPNRNDAARLRKLGLLVYRRFVEVANLIPAVYGAILVEYSLEEPNALEQDARSLAFRNFFVGKQYLSGKAINDVIKIAGNEAYLEQSVGGVYISMSGEFNPDGKTIASLEAQERSARIAAVLARAAR